MKKNIKKNIKVIIMTSDLGKDYAILNFRNKSKNYMSYCQVLHFILYIFFI